MRRGLTLPVFLLLLLFILTAGCGQINDQANEADVRHQDELALISPVKVIASIYPLADVVKQVGGELVEIRTMLPSGASEHTYELTPQQVKDFVQGELYVKIGQGLEFFDANLLAAQEEPVDQVVFADLVNLIEVEIVSLTSLKEQDYSHSYDPLDEDDDHEHEGPDPHVWLDPVLVRDVLVPAVYDNLVKLRPEQAAIFLENKISFQQQLTELDRLISSETASFSHRTFLVFHSAWRYFAQRYGLVDINIEEFPSQEVSLQRVAEVVEIARLTGAGAVFAEPQFSPRAAQVIAEEFGGEVMFLDPLGGPDLPGRKTYISLLEYNLEILKKALGQ